MIDRTEKALEIFEKDLVEILSTMKAVKGGAFAHAVALIFNAITLEQVNPAVKAIRLEFIQYLKCTQSLQYKNEVLDSVRTLSKKADELNLRLRDPNEPS